MAPGPKTAAATCAGLLLLAAPGLAWRLPAAPVSSSGPGALRASGRAAAAWSPKHHQHQQQQRSRSGGLRMMSDTASPPPADLAGGLAPLEPFRPDLGVGRDAKLTKVLALNGGEDFVRVRVDELTLSAVRKMNEKAADCCLIFDQAGKLAGIFTERDYIRKIVEAQRKTRETPISAVMTPAEQIISAKPDMAVGDCMALLVQNKIRHVPVVDADGTVRGVVSTTDLVNTMKRDDESLAGAFPIGAIEPGVVAEVIAATRDRANELAVKGGERLTVQDLSRGGLVAAGAGVLALLLQVRGNGDELDEWMVVRGGRGLTRWLRGSDGPTRGRRLERI